MAKFAKGISGNPNGRPKGSKNKSTATLRKKVDQILSDNMESVQSDLDALPPKDRLDFLAKLLRYSLPTFSNVTEVIDVDSLSDQQVDDLLERALQKMNNG